LISVKLRGQYIRKWKLSGTVFATLHFLHNLGIS
jgi:hypothetical protein